MIPRLVRAWHGMRRRCDPRSQNKAYRGCSIDERFARCEDFHEWAVAQIGHDQEWELDKDILVKNNRVYSPDACVFVPRIINTLMLRSQAIRGRLPIGVHHGRNPNRFRVQVSMNDRIISLGTYGSAEEAFHVYKAHKERIVKTLAEEWRDLVDPRVYAAMMAYEVDITD